MSRFKIAISEHSFPSGRIRTPKVKLLISLSETDSEILDGGWSAGIIRQEMVEKTAKLCFCDFLLCIETFLGFHLKSLKKYFLVGTNRQMKMIMGFCTFLLRGKTLVCIFRALQILHVSISYFLKTNFGSDTR